MRRAAFVLLAALVLVASPLAQAALTANVDARTISESDTLELYVRSTREGDETPDWSGLERNFDVLATRSATQVRSINGNVETERNWVLRLRPRGTGTLEIPAFELGGERSSPITIVVKPLDPSVRRAIDELVFFELEHSPDPVYVHGQLLVTRRLFYADGAQLYGELPEPPAVSDAVVHPLGEPHASTAVRNGRRYGVLEQSFAIFPEHPGNVRIPSASVSGSVTVALDPLAPPRRTGVQVSSKELMVEVLPVPKEYPSDQPWLPATNVEIVEAWEHDPPRLTVGEPITRTLIVRADANDASIIPPLAVPNVSMKTYPSPPELNETVGENGVIGTRTEAVTLVATTPGPLELPAVTLTWWDTKTNSVRIASVPARTLVVAAAPGASSPAIAAPNPAPELGPDAAPSNEAAASPDRDEPVPSAPSLRWWTLLLAVTTAICASGWAITALRSRTTSSSAPVAYRPRDPELVERVAFDELRRAAASGDLARTRAAFTSWTRARASIAENPLTDSRLKGLVDAIDEQLYGATPERNGNTDALLQRVVELRAMKTEKPKGDALPPLYFSPRVPS
jgi:hypothetical protein